MTLYPDKNKKARKANLFFAELEGLLPRLSVFETNWDCRVPGACSLKQPDKLYVMPDRYIHIELGVRLR